MVKSFRTSSQQRSPLKEVQQLKGSSSNVKTSLSRDLAIALPLTSLIDAFSIIVIYLLIGTQSSAVEVPAALLNLPVASYGQSIDKVVPVLRIQKGSYFLNDRPIYSQNLIQELSELKKNSIAEKIDLIVQADQNMPYTELDPLIKAGSLAGIEKLKFAVVPAK
jgi:biopolymer transport protein ExbD